MDEKPFLTIAEFAAALGVSTRSVERWVSQGLVSPAWRTPGGHARFGRDQIEELKAKGKGRKPPPPEPEPLSDAEKLRQAELHASRWIARFLVKRRIRQAGKPPR
ncbi:excisionase family DNA-binding protein [Azospirillum sp. RWY-5-1]|uniref:Excisionase family DNA-binding protein n=1 Tax=Azospirillum oleiclasticum TaxID=2735135 RepID=A0ABX2T6R2_9PROT|nr:helix-turn-helix domain-containing protein [Azospirillum oleiclasticum]NYZ11188.1 excisionase family DNA-binding protein [Azospirillum oleiclasticum]NYZ18350.1 excisionase family DNA-binding protein [Azospirillum oleiclasticum]